MPVYKKILQLLTPKERRRGYLLLLMILVMAFLDTVGVASIMPFMAVLGNPEIVETNRWLSLLFNRLGFTDPNSLLGFLGLVVFFVFVSSLGFKALTQWALLRFSYMRNHSLSCRLYMGYLDHPYSWFLNRHSADLGKTILAEVHQVIQQAMIPIMQLIAHGTVSLFLIFFLVLIDPFLALIIALVLGGAYSIIYITIRHYMLRIGKDRVVANKERFRFAQEAFGGIKEVKILGLEKTLFNRFVNPSFRVAKHDTNNQIAALLPRYILEMLAFGGILLIALYFFKFHGDFSRVLPILAVYAFAGYRLLPALQQVYQHLTKLRFGLPLLDTLYQDIMEFRDDGNRLKGQMFQPIIPMNSINLKDIHFTYSGTHSQTLKGLDLDIPVCNTTGLVGTTGSGKTTTVDIILGLLRPDKGQLLVDDVPVTSDNVRAWQRSLGYVPQQIYLADDSVAANIAFGIPPKDINMKSVAHAAKIAELHEFVTNDLDKGYDTLVGERGVRLSGGQRQRIGIARALYHDPKVLVMDEATSSLDNVTEKHVMESIRRMKGDRTIILIAHRLSTVRDCDTIYFLDHGQVIARGTYDELLQNCEEFREMAEGKDHNSDVLGSH
jgi:ATP-binding cassette, subfamily B, bacterial PglK